MISKAKLTIVASIISLLNLCFKPARVFDQGRVLGATALASLQVITRVHCLWLERL
jgi:hypothetical protein